MTAPAFLNPVSALWTGAYPFNLSQSYDATGAETLVVGMVIVNKRTFDPVCSFDGDAATLISHTDTAGDNGTIWLWRLDAPTQGTANVTIVNMTEYGPDGCLFVVGVDYDYPVADIIGDIDVVVGTGSVTNTATITSTGEDSATLAISTSHYGMALSVGGTPSPSLLTSQSSTPIRAALHTQQLDAAIGSTGTITNPINTAGFVALIEFVGGAGVQNITAGPMALQLEFGSGTMTVAGVQNIDAGPMSMQVEFGAGVVRSGIFPVELTPTHTITVTLKVTPSVLGARPATLRIDSNADGSPHLIPLTATGIATPLALTPLHTDMSGAMPVLRDADDNLIILRAVNWHGAEGENYIPHGHWIRSMDSMIEEIAAMGFNCIRLPFSGTWYTVGGSAAVPTAFSSVLNPQFVGKTTYECIDLILDKCEEEGIRVYLDHHRRSQGAGADGSPIGSGYTETDWQNTLVQVATRWAAHAAVIGIDMHNEPHELTWDQWLDYVEPAAELIHAAAPDWLIIVEGVGTHDSDSYWWGGQLAGVADRQVDITATDKTVYSPHEYGQSVAHQSWLAYDSETPPVGWPANLDAVWEAHWRFIITDNIAPVLIGEMGGWFGQDGDGAMTKPHATPEGQWMGRLVDTIVELGISYTYWTYPPLSGDTGGLLLNSWDAQSSARMGAIADIRVDYS